MNKPVTIKPLTIKIEGYTDKEIQYSTAAAMLHSSELQPNLKDLNIEPLPLDYRYRNNRKIDVKIAILPQGLNHPTISCVMCNTTSQH